MKKVFVLVGILCVGGVLGVGILYWQNLRGIGPVVLPPPEDITDVIEPSNGAEAPPPENNTDFPLTLADGFSISIFAKDLPGARAGKFNK